VLFTLSLVAPYAAFLLAHRLHTSGVLAVVVAGFVVSWRIHEVRAAARVEMYATWNMLTFLLNGLCFAIIGLEAPGLIAATKLANAPHLLWTAFMVSAAVIGARILWVMPLSYLPVILPRRVIEREGGYPPWKGVVLASWCGLRGVISLAAALSLPQEIESGTAFPFRAAVVACTVVVILVTLTVQGLTLEPLVRLLRVPHDADTEAEVQRARESVLKAGIARLDAYCSETSCPISVHHFRAAMADELAMLHEENEEERRLAQARVAVSQEVRQQVAHAQQAALLKMRDEGGINDKTYLDLQLELDRSHFETEPASA
jgi:CPA1 family monovalent cation:H+ antiporter